jgi:signal peptidase I
MPGRGSRRQLGLAVVRGRSMLPTLRDGDRLLVLHGGRPRPGRLVVVRLPAYGGAGGPPGAGSATARPGDGGGDRREIPGGSRSREAAGSVVAVKRAVHRVADGWWVERDNPREGVDSWSVGAVPEPDVIAVVVCRGPRALARGTGRLVRCSWRRVVRHIRRSQG